MDINAFKEATAYLEEEVIKKGAQVSNTKELTNVFYTVRYPHVEDLSPHLPWADIEFEERVSGVGVNPGEAWESLPEVWGSMREEQGMFSYTYSNRMFFQLEDIIEELQRNHLTREAFLAVWSADPDVYRLSKRRVPCTIGYLFQIRPVKGVDHLNLTYLQRSCNLKKHYQDDVYLAWKLNLWMAEQVGIAPGVFSHWVGSLHFFT